SYLRAQLGHLGETGPRGEADPQLMEAMGGIAGSVSAWTLDGDRLLFAALPQSIEAHFEALERGSVAQTEAFKQAAPRLAGARAAALTSLKPLIGTVYQIGLKVLRAVEPALRKAGVAVDTTLLPRAGSFASGLKPTTMMLLQDGDGLTFQGAGGGTTFVAVPVVAMVAAVAIPNIMQAKKQGNEAAAIGTLRTITTAQELFKERQNAYAEDLPALGKAQFIDRGAAMGMKNGYRFRIVASSSEGWSAVAVPLQPGKTGDRSFYVDQTGVIRFTYGGEEPSAESPALE
ncbi:MAG TPA: hypothetical protein VHF22_14780, partial [Planctomycetota bacterium]|nr:hypothetical protein [Planctomycetota bacterium]